MVDKIVIAVLGNPNSGKSYTWNTLFRRTVKTGKETRRLNFTDSEWIDVFLVSGSPEERNTYVGKIIGEKSPSIVLCSMQYRENVKETINYFLDKEYSMFVQWLNPGFSDPDQQPDSLELMWFLLNREGVVSIRNGKAEASLRVQELRDFIYGWARSRNLIRTTDVRS